MFSLKNVLNDQLGSILVSVILGLGIAAMFRKVCKGRNCIVLRGPDPDDIKKNIYEWQDRCYKYNPVATKCQNKKNLIKQLKE